MDDRVTAHVFLELAKANDVLAKLEALEKEVPVLSGTSNRRLLLSRRVNNARNLASGWARVYALLEMEATAEREGLRIVQERLMTPPKVTWCDECRHPTHPGNTCTMAVDVDTDHEQECGCETPAPERTVAWETYVEDGPNVRVCNNRSGCKNWYGPQVKWTPLTSDDLPEGGVCARCGTDVLA